MEPVDQMIELGRVLDRHGFDVFWLGEAYPWWRKHAYEARSSTSLSALIAHETERVGVGWGIISPYTRHPIQVAMEVRVVQEVAGPARFMLGFGASRIFMKEAVDQSQGKPRPLTAVREAIQIVRAILAGGEVSFRGHEFSAEVPPLSDEADAPRDPAPIYVAATGPKMLRLSGEIGDGLLTASITTPAFVRYARGPMSEGAAAAGRNAEDLDVGCVIVASIDEDSERGRNGAREIAGMYLANKVQNIQAAADVLLEKADLTVDEIRPIAEALDRGGRRAAAAAVTDEVFAKCKPIAGTPSECIEMIEEFREAGCTHMLLELWGENRLAQAELFGRKVLPHFRKE
jgi:5,10-methylenetetrahydromethanopterin reductase